MPDFNNPGPENVDSGFVKKTVESPVVLDSQTRKLLASPSAGGFKGFYRANKFYFWAIIVGLAIIGVMSFFAFRKQPVSAPKEANVSVSFPNTNNTVPAGGTMVYYIHIQNNDSQKLVGVQLELTYPDGFGFLGSSSPNQPDNLSGTLFSEPDLIPGQDVTTIVQAKANGNVNDTKTLSVRLHYKYSNFNSEFIKQQQQDVRLVASDVVLDISGPATANNGQPVIYTVRYQNNSDHDIANARIQMDYPGGFGFAAGNPSPDSNNNTWNLSALPKGQSGSFQIQGSFNSVNPGESRSMAVEFKILGSDGNYFTQSQASCNTVLASLPLLVTQEVQTQTAASIANPGDTLTYTIKYQNNGSTVATGVNIVVSLDAKALDLSTITTQGGQVNNSSIIWNASNVPGLDSLSPSESGQLSFSVQVKNPATKDSSKNLAVNSSVKIKANEYDSYFPGNDLSVKISSPASISPALVFLSGALPPQVGKPTVYKVSLSLVNSTNDYSDGVLTAFLPLAAGSFNSSSVNAAENGKVDFDASTGKLTWRFGNLPAHTGQFSQVRVLSFNLSLSPASSQANTSPILVKSIQLQAKDTFTQNMVTVSANDVTTASLSGGSGYSNGQVQP